MNVRGEEDRDEHQERADEREEDELHGGVDAPLSAPDADDEVHRHEHHFPEHVEEQRVEGDEASDHARLEEEERHDVALELLDLLPARHEQHGDREDRRQEHEGEREAVDAELVADPEAGDPGPVDREGLRRGGSRVEAAVEHDADSEGEEGRREADRLRGQLRGPGEEHEDEGAQGGQKDERREEVGAERVEAREGHRPISATRRRRSR